MGVPYYQNYAKSLDEAGPTMLENFCGYEIFSKLQELPSPSLFYLLSYSLAELQSAMDESLRLSNSTLGSSTCTIRLKDLHSASAWTDYTRFTSAHKLPTAESEQKAERIRVKKWSASRDMCVDRRARLLDLDKHEAYRTAIQEQKGNTFFLKMTADFRPVAMIVNLGRAHFTDFSYFKPSER